MEILFNKEGTPLMGFSQTAFISTSGAPDSPAKIKGEDDTEKIDFDGYKIVPWLDQNDFPDVALKSIDKTGVLNTGLRFLRNVIIGQGVFPCNVTGYNPDGSEQLQVINDKELIKIVKGRMVRKYMEKSLRDYLKLGSSFVQVIPSLGKNKVHGLHTINGRHGRIGINKKNELALIVSAKWPEKPGEKSDYDIYHILNDYDPVADYQEKVKDGRYKNKFVFHLRDDWSNDDYYPKPIWWSAYLAGWVDVANQVPQFIKKANENQISWLWHVKIPYKYWDKRYKPEDYEDKEERQKLIQQDMDKIEETLTSTKNANKALFSHFSVNPQSGKPEDQWEIVALDNKYKEGDKLVTSAAANSELLFCLMINPNVLGAGMPGGTYAGNQGGSNIREAFLINVANAWIDRQNLMDPVEMMLEINGNENVEIRFLNTILTTLDTGAGTSKSLS